MRFVYVFVYVFTLALPDKFTNFAQEILKSTTQSA